MENQYLVVILSLFSSFSFTLGSSNQNACQLQCNNVTITPQTTTACPVIADYAIVTEANIAKHARKLVLKQGSKTDLCSEFHIFSKYVKVFDLYFVATSKSPDYKVLHGASVLYQYIDNDDDGKPDNMLVYNKLVEMKATMYMFYDPAESEANSNIRELAWNNCPDVMLQDLQSSETHPGSITPENFDASLEECFHLVTIGWTVVYPELNPHLNCIMDCARGGKFQTPPTVYPIDAWYTYDDATCDYWCQSIEYIYWGLTTYLGAQQKRKEKIQNEWLPSTCQELKSTDEAMYNLVRDPKYLLPKKLPVGVFYGTVSGGNNGDRDELDGDDGNVDDADGDISNAAVRLNSTPFFIPLIITLVIAYLLRNQ